MQECLRWLRIVLPTVLLLAASLAYACTVCVLPGDGGLALPDTRLLEVAIATRKAVERGVIPEAAKAGSDSILAQAPDSSLLRFWAMKEKTLGLSTNGPVHIVLVDTSRSFALSYGPQGLSVSPDTSGSSTLKIIITRKTLLALLNGALLWEQAHQHGLMQLVK